MSLKTTAIAAITTALLAGATIGQAQSSRSHNRTVYTVPGTNLRVNREPRHIYKFGGTTVYQFSRNRTGFSWPYGYPAGYGYYPAYGYPTGYSYPYAYPYYGYP